MTSEVMELPVPNSLDAAAGSVVKSSHEITARGKRRGQKRCRGTLGVIENLFKGLLAGLREFVCWIYHQHNSTVLIKQYRCVITYQKM